MDTAELFKNAGLKVRAPQLEMVEAVRSAVELDENTIISAGTGVGKTFAYLVGAWLGMKQQDNKRCLVISTNTVALQEQLLLKDLPFLEKLLNEKISFTLVKGRQRYFCQRRFENLTTPDWQEEIEYIKKQLTLGWAGDIDQLSSTPHYLFWQEVNNQSATCSHKRCHHYQNCAFFEARKRLKKYDILVINHSLLMAHLVLGDGAILPEFKDHMLVIDECHHLPQKALDAFASHATLLASQEWLKDIDKQIKDTPVQFISIKQRERLLEEQQSLMSALLDAQKILEQIYQQHTDEAHQVIRLLELPQTLKDVGKFIVITLEYHLMLLSKAKQALDEQEEEGFRIDKKVAEKRYSAIGFLIERAANLHQLWQMILREEQPPIAKWFYPNKQAEAEKDLIDHQQDYMVCAGYIEADKMLKTLLWKERQHSVVLCSATIKSLGSFKRYIDSVGIDARTTTKHLPSPFPYEESQLVIPAMQTNPSNKEAHIVESVEVIESELMRLETGGLVLFTSVVTMRDVFSYLSQELKSQIIIQGEKPKSVILEQHKKMLDRGVKSIIFGVDSFAEGVDLPGKYLELLIIFKLPFAVPSHPIEQTRNEWLEEQGKVPFFEVTLPTTSIKLTQMVGRLIRDEQDQGKVIILDNRIIKKRYGQQLLADLPNFDVSYTL